MNGASKNERGMNQTYSYVWLYDHADAVVREFETCGTSEKHCFRDLTELDIIVCQYMKICYIAS